MRVTTPCKAMYLVHHSITTTPPEGILKIPGMGAMSMPTWVLYCVLRPDKELNGVNEIHKLICGYRLILLAVL